MLEDRMKYLRRNEDFINILCLFFMTNESFSLFNEKITIHINLGIIISIITLTKKFHSFFMYDDKLESDLCISIVHCFKSQSHAF